MSQYSAHYKTLHEEELVALALRGGLIEEAETALREELRARGITDLSQQASEREAEQRAEDQYRQQQLTARAKVLTWRTRLLYVLAALSMAYGTILFVNHDPSKSAEDGGLLMLIGAAAALFAFVSHRLTRLWHERVLLRKQPK